jgi:hypothetical protein
MRGNIAKIFEALNELGRVIIVLDEAQYLRYSTIGLRPILAHVYDYMTGNYVGSHRKRDRVTSRLHRDRRS